MNFLSRMPLPDVSKGGICEFDRMSAAEMRLKLVALQISTYFKQAIIVLTLLLVFVLVAVESVFFATISVGDGVVTDYHKLETNTGTEGQLVVRYKDVDAVGKFHGVTLPSKDDDVRVVYQESIILKRPHYYFTSPNNHDTKAREL